MQSFKGKFLKVKKSESCWTVTPPKAIHQSICIYAYGVYKEFCAQDPVVSFLGSSRDFKLETFSPRIVHLRILSLFRRRTKDFFFLVNVYKCKVPKCHVNVQ